MSTALDAIAGFAKSAVKRGRSSAPSPVDAAQRKIDSAQEALDSTSAALEAERSRHAEAISAAESALENEPSDARSEEVGRLKSRAVPLIELREKAVVKAHAALAAAEEAQRDARLAEFDAVVAGVGAKMDELAAKARSHVESLAALIAERDALTSAAFRANEERCTLRGLNIEQRYPYDMGIRSAENRIAQKLKTELGQRVVDQAVELLGAR